MIRQTAWTPGAAVLLNVGVYGAGFLILRRLPADVPRSRGVPIRRWFDLPSRAAAVALFVSAVVVGSAILGAEATGIAAVFPISLTCLIILSGPRPGDAASARIAATALRAMLGFGLALLALHLAIRPFGATGALTAALLVCVAWSGGLIVLNERSRVRPSPLRSPDRTAGSTPCAAGRASIAVTPSRPGR
jgi:hypothetical protein